jgi:PAS domain-containing protein
VDRSPQLRYGVVVLAVGSALLLKLLLDPLIVQETPFLLVFAAVMVSAWYGGLGPGLLAVALTAPAVGYFFLYPIDSLSGLGSKAIPLGFFVLGALLVNGVAVGRRSAKQRAEANAREAQRHQGGLRRSEERLRLLVEGVKDYAIFMLDPDGYIVSWNAGAERIEGYQVEEVVGKHLSLRPVKYFAAFVGDRAGVGGERSAMRLIGVPSLRRTDSARSLAILLPNLDNLVL